MRKLHLAIDLDDVVLEFMPSVMECFYREYGIKPKFDGQTWGPLATEFYKHPLFAESGYRTWWDWLHDRSWLWSTFPAVPGAIGGIKRLREAGHYLECVTSKPEWAEYNVWKWMGKWRPPFQQVTIINSGQKKIDFTDAEVMIDDKLATIEEFRKAGRLGLHFDQSASTPGAQWNWEQIIANIRMFDGRAVPKYVRTPKSLVVRPGMPEAGERP